MEMAAARVAEEADEVESVSKEEDKEKKTIIEEQEQGRETDVTNANGQMSPAMSSNSASARLQIADEKKQEAIDALLQRTAYTIVQENGQRK